MTFERGQFGVQNELWASGDTPYFFHLTLRDNIFWFARRCWIQVRPSQVSLGTTQGRFLTWSQEEHDDL